MLGGQRKGKRRVTLGGIEKEKEDFFWREIEEGSGQKIKEERSKRKPRPS